MLTITIKACLMSARCFGSKVGQSSPARTDEEVVLLSSREATSSYFSRAAEQNNFY